MASVGVAQEQVITGQPAGQPSGSVVYPAPGPQPPQQFIIVSSQPEGQKCRGQPQNIREWSTGICGCCQDCGGCCYACCCYPCFMCSLANKMSEFMCGPLCCGTIFTVAMRTKVRTMYGIRGSILGDCCCMAWCEFCSVLQMDRELHHQMRTLM